MPHEVSATGEVRAKPWRILVRYYLTAGQKGVDKYYVRYIIRAVE